MDGMTPCDKLGDYGLSKHAGGSCDKNLHDVLSSLESVLPCSLIRTLDREAQHESDR